MTKDTTQSINGTSVGLADTSASPEVHLGNPPITSTADPVKTFTQEEVNDLVGGAKHRGYDKGVRDAQLSSGLDTQPSQNSNFDVEALVEKKIEARLIKEKEHAKQAREQEELDRAQAVQNQKFQMLGQNIQQAVQEKPEYEVINKIIDGGKCYDLVAMASNFDNGHDVLKHLADNTDQLAKIQTDLSFKPDSEVLSEISVLSTSLKQKKEALDLAKKEKLNPNLNASDTNNLSPSPAAFSSGEGSLPNLTELRKRPGFTC